MHSLKRVFTSSILLFILTGCTANVNLLLSDSKTNVSIEFWDEAKNSIINDPLTDQKILNLLANKSGNPVDRVVSKNSISYATWFTNEKNLSDVISIRAEKVSKDRNFKIYIKKPQRLEKALESTLIKSNSGNLLLNTYKKNIVFNVKYTSTDKIDSVQDNSGIIYKHSRNSVYFQYNLYNVPEKIVTVKKSFDYLRFYPILLLALIYYLYKYVIKRKNIIKYR